MTYLEAAFSGPQQADGTRAWPAKMPRDVFEFFELYKAAEGKLTTRTALELLARIKDATKR